MYQPSPYSILNSYSDHLATLSEEELSSQLAQVNSARESLTPDTMTAAREFADVTAAAIQLHLDAIAELKEQRPISVAPLDTYRVDEHLQVFPQ